MMPESLNIKDHNRLILVTCSSPPKHEVGDAETGERPRPNKGTELSEGERMRTGGTMAVTVTMNPAAVSEAIVTRVGESNSMSSSRRGP